MRRLLVLGMMFFVIPSTMVAQTNIVGYPIAEYVGADTAIVDIVPELMEYTTYLEKYNSTIHEFNASHVLLLNLIAEYYNPFDNYTRIGETICSQPARPSVTNNSTLVAVKLAKNIGCFHAYLSITIPPGITVFAGNYFLFIAGSVREVFDHSTERYTMDSCDRLTLACYSSKLRVYENGTVKSDIPTPYWHYQNTTYVTTNSSTHTTTVIGTTTVNDPVMLPYPIGLLSLVPIIAFLQRKIRVWSK